VLDADPALAAESARACGGYAQGCDVADRAAVAAACAAVEAELGPVDILVNNAGISPKHDGRPAPVFEMAPEEWDRVLAVNLTGAWNLIRQLAPGMVARRSGRIVNQASVAGKAHVPFVGCHYAATKAALIGLTRHLAGELGPHGIAVNALAPGRIETALAASVAPETNAAVVGQTPLRRLGTSEEVARAVCFLTGPDSEFVTGQTLDVAGGWMMT
jgi:3-oxoacyl-[acyl-carrier protein] reductase